MQGIGPISEGLRRKRKVANISIIIATLLFARLAGAWKSDWLLLVGTAIVRGPLAVYYGLYISRLICPRCGEHFFCKFERNSALGWRLFSPLCVPEKCPECGYREAG